jgi:hypothetical protein
MNVTYAVIIPALNEETNLGISLGAEILCFLDADCEITADWKSALRDLLRERPRNLVTGSKYSSPPRSGWLARSLAALPRTDSIKHLPSGNLVVTRDVFDLIGGFNPRLSTGEDYDFCQRALAANARLERRPEFRVYHHGYPRTIGQYFRRERWHGRGDFESARSFVRSRPAQLGLLHILSAAAGLSIWIAFSWIWGGAIYLIGGILPAIGMAALRSRGSVANFGSFLVLFWLYFLARGLSLLDVHVLRAKHRWR